MKKLELLKEITNESALPEARNTSTKSMVMTQKGPTPANFQAPMIESRDPRRPTPTGRKREIEGYGLAESDARPLVRTSESR